MFSEYEYDVYDVYDVMYKYLYISKANKSLGLGLHGVLHISTLLKFSWLKPVLAIVTRF